MHKKFRNGAWYTFASFEARQAFCRRFEINSNFARWVKSEPFQVTSLSDNGNVIHVNDSNSLPYEKDIPGQILISADNERKFFKEIPELSWCEDASYKLSNAQGLYNASIINTSFLRKIGRNPFKVLSVTDGTYAPITNVIEYLDTDGIERKTHFTFSVSELEYFKVWNHDLEHNWPRGQPLINALRPKIAPVESSEVEIYDEIQELSEVGEEAQVRAFIEVTGSINIEIKDEDDRLKAIEYLNSIRFIEN